MRKRCWRRPEPMADAVTTTLGEAASTVLLTADPHAKVMAARAAARNWRLGRLAHVFDTVLPDRPARPDKPELLPPSHIPRRGNGGSDRSRVAIRHALAASKFAPPDPAFALERRWGGGVEG